MNKISLTLIGFVAAVSLSAGGCDAQNTKDRSFDERVHAYLIAHPEVIQEAIESLQAKQEAQKDAIARSAIVQNREALFHDARDAVVGNPNGPVTVVEFFDFRCPFCKAAAPEIAKLLTKHRDVRLVLKQFPILDVEDQSHVSEDAARAALGALAQGKYPQVHDALLSYTHLDEAGIKQVLQDQGVDTASDAAVAQSKAVTDYLAQNRRLAHTLGVDGTPAFVVGDKMIAGARMDDLEAALSAAKTSR